MASIGAIRELVKRQYVAANIIDGTPVHRFPSISEETKSYGHPSDFIRERVTHVWAWVQEKEATRHIFDIQPFTFKRPPEIDPEQRERVSYKLIPLPAKGEWSKPLQRPTKKAGRKGTKRAWKRANAPTFVLVPSGDPAPELAIVSGAVMAEVSKLQRRKMGWKLGY